MSLLALFLTAALAQDVPSVPEVDGDLFRPAIDARYTLWTDDPGRAQTGHVEARLVTHWMNRAVTFRLQSESGTEDVRVVGDALSLSATGAVWMGPVRIGLILPVYAVVTSDVDGLSGGGLGDVVLDVKGTVLDEQRHPLGLAFAASISAPTATVAAPLEAQGVTFDLRAIAQRRWGPVFVGANLGYRHGPKVDTGTIQLGNALQFRVGGGWLHSEQGGLSLEVVGQAGLADKLFAARSAPIEGMLGGWYRVAGPFVVRAGLGTGLNAAIGSPRVRAVLSLGYEPPRGEDRDWDGVVDASDVCPDEAEDKDRWEDADGCPDLDNDGDGLVDKIDACPDVAEDMNQYADDDGCPDAVRATVRVVDPSGLGVTDAIVWIGDEEPVAIPEEGYAADLLPGTWRIRAQAPGYQEGFVSLVFEAGAEEDVVILVEPVRAVLTSERIEISESVYFDTNRATIRPESHDLLDDVVTVLREHPELTRLRIEGHTDSRGETDFNQDLSERRAAAVRAYLVRAGIEPERLVSEGFGESRPIAKGETEEAWAQNRRVEFVVVERSDGAE